tara:strand:+ start:5530 stop:5700 length:171 start_codon:yes stop_codon:yes gene_type:complete
MCCTIAMLVAVIAIAPTLWADFKGGYMNDPYYMTKPIAVFIVASILWQNMPLSRMF